MTPQNELEIHGNFLANPFAELLAEIMHAGLDGSLRIGHSVEVVSVGFLLTRVLAIASRNRGLFREDRFGDTPKGRGGRAFHARRLRYPEVVPRQIGQR